MKRVLIDLNIIIDMLNKRMDHESALVIYDLCSRRIIKGYIAAHEITTLSYFLEKDKATINKRNRIINNLLDNLSVLSPNETILRKSLDSDINDYEDAVIDELATKEELDFIITRNYKDFSKSKNQIYTAREAIEILK
ncbi:PIN domain-containing protein [Spirochaeta lutea]|uniref:PIN domain-containing protein n=1 Tax=Spirochaeta lutea TaxID=1480694 RepID=A0A098QXG4_9SPIO|nr:PIN domain-containing protein [Spirochaeta lutea]KGE72123.1 hypothetical protein DC28_07750 [Spirochaeta lutea]